MHCTDQSHRRPAQRPQRSCQAAAPAAAWRRRTCGTCAQLRSRRRALWRQCQPQAQPALGAAVCCSRSSCLRLQGPGGPPSHLGRSLPPSILASLSLCCCCLAWPQGSPAVHPRVSGHLPGLLPAAALWREDHQRRGCAAPACCDCPWGAAASNAATMLFRHQRALHATHRACLPR